VKLVELSGKKGIFEKKIMCLKRRVRTKISETYVKA
jgi:hypothetical protein